MRSRTFSVILVSLHLVACAFFLVLRQPGITHLAERERERKESGYFFLSSADPYMFIAERPLNNWSPWHGGEDTWVKLLEIANLPSLVLTAIFGGIAIEAYRSTGSGDFSTDTWLRAYVFLAFSIVQWWLVGRRLAKSVYMARVWSRGDG